MDVNFTVLSTKSTDILPDSANGSKIYKWSPIGFNTKKYHGTKHWQ